MSLAPDILPKSVRAAQVTAPYRRRLFTGWTRVKYDALVVIWLGCLIYFWSWWLNPMHILPGAGYWVATVALVWLSFLQLFFMLVFRRAEAPGAEPPAPNSVRVAMITTKTPSEPFSVVKRTLEAMLDQSYPHDTWLADEDPQPETVAWCEANGVRISTRKDVPEYHRAEWPRRTRCKEGNLAYFYDHYGYEQYDFVSQLDADHVPTRTYLEEIMRGFADPEVGYVSAPSICSNNAKESWAARTRLYTESAFHGAFQCGYAGVASSLCIGSHYAVRTKALREVGGLGPELAEDHSTTLLMNAGGWRGMHAIDAIATGDGPATFADLCVQEFQWSRSLVTLLLRYTPAYLADLPLKLKLLFIFCQIFYPMIAVSMFVLYLVPIAAVLGDFRYADVTYPDFLKHSMPGVTVMVLIAFTLRADGFFRPFRGKVIAWEKALFLCIQWPWVAWGCLMALWDHVSGRFVDFRITPKGEAAVAKLPFAIYLPYLILGLGSLLPVLLIDGLVSAPGFYLLCLLNAIAYVSILLVAVIRLLRDSRTPLISAPRLLQFQLVGALVLAAMFASGLAERGKIGLYVVAIGLEPVQLVRVQYVVSGAGMGAPGTLNLTFDPSWNTGKQRRGKG